MPGFDRQTVWAANVNFNDVDSTQFQHPPTVTTDGQLLIGSTIPPNIRIGTLTASGGMVITSGAGTIDINGAGAGTPTTYAADAGSATPAANILNIVGGASGVHTAGAGNTVTLSLSAIPNSSLTNSSVTLSNGNNITITGSPVSLGAAATINVSGTTDHCVQLGNATGSLTSLTNGTTGQVLTAVTGADPTWSTPSGGFTWSVLTVDASFTVNTGTIANKAGLLTMTLPATAAIGDIIEITGINTAAGWLIAQNANQQVFIGTSSTTLGAGGSIASINIRDSLRMVCVVAGANTAWNVLSSMGNLTIV